MQLGNIHFDRVHPWLGYGGLAFTDQIYFINEEGQEIEMEMPEEKEALKENCYLRFPITLLNVTDAIEYSIRSHKESFSLMDHIMRDSNFAHYYIVKDLSLVNDNLYIAKYMDKKIFDSRREESVYSLVRVKDGKPQIISRFYKKIKPWLIEEETFIAQTMNNQSWVHLSSEGEEMNIFFGDKVGKEEFTSTTFPLDNSIKNSLFLEEKYKEMIFLLESSKEELDSESQNTIIAQYQKNYLQTELIENFISNEMEDMTRVESIYPINEESLALAKLNSKYPYALIYPNGDYFVYGERSSISSVDLDPYDHILLTIPYGNRSTQSRMDKRQILIDKNGSMLIGLSLEISLENEHYIVTKCDFKKQVYDRNGMPLTTPSDQVDFVDKLYVSKDGMIRGKESKLAVTNYGCTYVLEEDKDYLIYQDTKFNDILGKIKMLTYEQKDGD